MANGGTIKTTARCCNPDDRHLRRCHDAHMYIPPRFADAGGYARHRRRKQDTGVRPHMVLAFEQDLAVGDLLVADDRRSARARAA